MLRTKDQEIKQVQTRQQAEEDQMEQTTSKMFACKISSAKRLAANSKISRLLLVGSLLAILLVSLIINTSPAVECHNIKRTQYHEQGLHGPKSYKFGFTAGDHKNPQERHEVSDGHGHVKGYYSFIDGAGKHQVVHYEAHPKYGFKVFNHKEKAYNNGKRHYNSR